MLGIDCKINSCLFPFEFAIQHFKAVSLEEEWRGRCVHVILGVLEILPTGVNYIIAIFDAVFFHAPVPETQPPVLENYQF